MRIREYETRDLDEIANLFYDTVHTVNRKDYTQEQVDVWASGTIDRVKWDQSLLEHYSVVAVEDNLIVGFGDMDATGYLDRLYVHKEYQGQGIATAICDALEDRLKGRTYFVHASITAKCFFEKRGYVEVKKQQVERAGVLLTNYVMKKEFKEEEQMDIELLHKEWCMHIKSVVHHSLLYVQRILSYALRS